MPPVRERVVVQIPHRPPPGLHPPVLAVAAIGPPRALDPPPPDHVGDVEPAAPPLEAGGDPSVVVDAHFLVVPLRHGLPLPRRCSNVCSIGPVKVRRSRFPVK